MSLKPATPGTELDALLQVLSPERYRQKRMARNQRLLEQLVTVDREPAAVGSADETIAAFIEELASEESLTLLSLGPAADAAIAHLARKAPAATALFAADHAAFDDAAASVSQTLAAIAAHGVSPDVIWFDDRAQDEPFQQQLGLAARLFPFAVLGGAGWNRSIRQQVVSAMMQERHYAADVLDDGWRLVPSTEETR